MCWRFVFCLLVFLYTKCFFPRQGVFCSGHICLQVKPAVAAMAMAYELDQTSNLYTKCLYHFWILHDSLTMSSIPGHPLMILKCYVADC